MEREKREVREGGRRGRGREEGERKREGEQCG